MLFDVVEEVRKKFSGFLLLMIIGLSVLGGAVSAEARVNSLGEAGAEAAISVEASSLESLAGNLLSHVEKSRIQVEEAFSSLESNGVEVPEEAVESYEKGVNASVNAVQLLEEGRFRESSTISIQALRHFKEALQQATKARPHTPPEDLGEKAVGLRRAIERARIFLYKVNQTAESLADHGFDPTEIWLKLKEANQTLDRALEHLNEGYINETAQLLAEAQGIMGQTNGLLQKLANQVKAWKAQQFVQQVEHRIQSLERNINQIQEQVSQAQGVLSSLQAKKQIILRIRNQLTTGQLEEAVEDLNGVVEDIETTLDQLNGEGTSAQLKTMNRIEATIHALNYTAQWLRGKGASTGNIQQELQNTRTLLSEITNKLQEGDTEAIKELLEQAQQQLQQTEQETQLTQQKVIQQQPITWIDKVLRWRTEEKNGD